MMVNRVEEIDARGLLDTRAFSISIVHKCKPVILRNLCQAWPAVFAASEGWEALSSYVRRFDSGQTGPSFIGARAADGRYFYGDQNDGFNFSREALTVTQVLERIAETFCDPKAPTVYLGSIPIEQMLPGFSDENQSTLLDAQIKPRLWLGSASHVACHYDTFENLACIVYGHRRFQLYPPDCIADLYVGPIDHTIAGAPVALAVEAEGHDPRYPRFNAVRDKALIAELGPGDALFLPKLWWHKVDASGSANLMVNYWWDEFKTGPDAPFTTLLLAMTAIAERPLAERRAWAAWFDHYVFRPDGHPLRHLPADEHGILGPLKQGNLGRIRAFVMQALRGG